MVGGIIVFVGCVSSAFVVDAKLLHLTFGVIAGTGLAFAFTPAVIVLGYYFKSRLFFASGISVTGAGIGMIISPIINQVIYVRYQYDGFMLLLGAVGLNFCVFGSLMAPNSTEIKAKMLETAENNGRVFSCNKNNGRPCLLKNWAFNVYCISLVFGSLQYSFITQFLVVYSIQSGRSLLEASFLLSLSGIASAISRPFTGLVANDNKIEGLLLYFGPHGILGICTLFFMFYGKYYIGQLIYAFFFGLYTAFLHVMLGPLTTRLVGLSRLAQGFGYVTFFLGFGSLFGPPVGGLVQKMFGSLEFSFVAAGFVQLLTSLTGMMIVLLEKGSSLGDGGVAEACLKLEPMTVKTEDCERKKSEGAGSESASFL